MVNGKWKVFYCFALALSLAACPRVSAAAGPTPPVAGDTPVQETPKDPPKEKPEIRVVLNTAQVLTGFSLPAEKSALGQVVEATVTPPAGIDEVRFEAAGAHPERISLEVLAKEKDAVKGLIRVKVLGRVATPAEQPGGDTLLQAKVRGAVSASAAVVVVVPATQTHVVAAPFIKNYTKQVAPDKIYFGSRAGSVVTITILDQFGKKLDPLYDGANVVTEQFFEIKGRMKFSAAEVPINLPDNQLKNGVKLDFSGADCAGSYKGPYTAEELKQWEDFKYTLDGSNNAFGIFLVQDADGQAVQRLKVHGHSLTPDFLRKHALRKAKYPPIPAETSDEPVAK